MELLIEHCGVIFSQNRGLFMVFFLAGLTGGFTHCLAMCGSIVASETIACKSKCGTSCGKAKFASATGWDYHLGRMTTYGAMGFVVALLSKQIASFTIWHWVSALMLVVAGVMFILSSLPNCKHKMFNPSGRLTYVRGVLLGFMPCGLLYAALMMAATTANPLLGMVLMLVFVVGTIPALLVAAVGANMLTDKWQGVMQKIGRVVMAFNGVSLIVIAGRMVG